MSGIARSSAKWRLELCLWLLGSAAIGSAGCVSGEGPQDRQAAIRNAASLYSARETLFGRPETGWAIYAPKVAETTGAATGADTPGFAHAVALWRGRNGLEAVGDLDGPALMAMKRQWQAARPFVALRAKGVCPDPPAAHALATLDADDSYGDRPLLLRRGALRAYRGMVGLARRSQPALRRRPDLLRIFSAYRSPERDAARCAAEGNCQGVVRAACSSHRTGLAIDLVLDTAPGFAVDNSADANRLAMARGLAYRWLLAEAPRFGFVNYAFEPWHWEWTGEPP